MAPLLRSVALLTALLAPIANAVRPVEVRGQDFVDTVTNKRLMIIGVDYQPGGQAGYKPQEKKDALTDKDVCFRDATLLQRLGVNTIRVYNVDPTLNHDDCASIFNAAGIYMIIDVNSPFGGESLDRSKPWTSYHKGYLGRIFGVVENFKNYPNTLAFFAANEVMNDVGTAEGQNPRYIRAVQRDLKNYIAKHSDRPIPVGYSAADVREILEDTWAYFQCGMDGEDDKSRSDFFGLNSYSWCGGEASFQTAGYNILVDMFKGSTIPVFFSEYGCNEVQPRVFNEVEALYGKEMTSLSGGLVYEYSQEEADYGLVQINDDNITLRTDYDNLQKMYNKLDIKLIQSTDASGKTTTPPKCSEKLISNSGFSKNFTIPALPEGGKDLIEKGVKNANKGKLVDVKAPAKLNMPVYGTNGEEVQGLALKLLSNDESNVPGGETTSGNGEAASADGKKGSASTLSVNSGCAVLLFSVFMGVLTFL